MYECVLHRDVQYMMIQMFCNVVLCLTGGALAEGFQERLKEFQSFEKSFKASVRKVEPESVCVCVCMYVCTCACTCLG